ncbi:hypothetical protein [Echinicola rosea]|uniref:Bacteriocin n=1 Tax=Echinicola rosea TaxID=1807691 RepID=A0ABQ1V030_9BACT|nr:hypothetical protein [Echinicola rosea]GGF32710.1 hypothetical protein GCM10011339_21080 [Echinicola rosea]
MKSINLKELSLKEERKINGGDDFSRMVAYYFGRAVRAFHDAHENTTFTMMTMN